MKCKNIRKLLPAKKAKPAYKQVRVREDLYQRTQAMRRRENLKWDEVTTAFFEWGLIEFDRNRKAS